jgi:hypothetical protein
MIAFAAIVGLVAVPLYAILHRLNSSGRESVALGLSTFLIFFPAIALLGLRWIVWPLAEMHLPAVAYSVGTNAAQQRIKTRVLSSVRVGDREEQLREDYPYVFERPFVAMSGSTDTIEYSIQVTDGVVSNVTVENLY